MESILLIITMHPSWPPFCSLKDNELGAEGGKAIGEALKVNKSITNIK